MTLTEEQKKEIRHMVETHPGWKALQRWCEEYILARINGLVEKEDPELRGQIKGMRAILNTVNKSLKKYEEERQEKESN